MKFILLLRTKLLQLENILLVSAFLITLLVAVLQILLRNFFDNGILWGDSFLRIAVLWLAMMGALFASRHNNHININIGLRFLAKKKLKFVNFIVHFFTALICGFVAWYGFNLLLMEYEEAGVAFTLPFANVPIWLTVSIIPIGFTIMAMRYLTRSLMILSGQIVCEPMPGKQTLSNQSLRQKREEQ